MSLGLIKLLLVITVVLVLIKALLFYFRRDLNRITAWKLFKDNPTIPDVIMNMTGPQFEVYVQGLFQKAGISAKTVGGIGDHGIDLITVYNGKRIAVQCKKYYKSYGRNRNFSGYVGEPEVRNLYGSQKGGGFDKSVLITTGYYSKAAWSWAKNKSDISLISKKELRDIISEPSKIKRYL